MDILHAARWYEDREGGLGRALVTEIDEIFRRIEQRPQGYPVTYGQFRRALVRRFPYAIYYIVDGRNVTIIGVLHQRQSRELLNRRVHEK